MDMAAILVRTQGAVNKFSFPLPIEVSHKIQLIRFARVCSHADDLNTRNKCFTAKLLIQGYRYHKLRKAFSKCYRRHYELISEFNVGLKSLLHQGLSAPEFYCDLVCKFKRLDLEKIKCVTNVLAII